MKFFVICFLLIGTAHAADCEKSLSEPQLVWEQVIEDGRPAAITLSAEDPFQNYKRYKNLVFTWIKRMIHQRIFQQFNLKNGQTYSFPVTALLQRKSTDLILSIEVTRTKNVAGSVSYFLENFKTLNDDQFLILLAGLSQQTQTNWKKSKFDIEISYGLPVYRGLAMSVLELQIKNLMDDKQNLIDLANMPKDSQITFLRPEKEIAKNKISSARRFVFHKTREGVIQLLAFEP